MNGKRFLKSAIFSLVFLLVCTTAYNKTDDKKKKTAFTTEKDKISYSLGVNFATSLKREDIPVNPDIILKAMNDVMQDKELSMTDEEMHTVIQDLQKKQREKQMAKQKAESDKNATEGDKFREENAKKDGVVVLPSGLQYKILKPGSGESPKATDTVKVNYKGTLIDGTEFDSSYSRNQPATFQVNRVIKGWTEALQLMKPGAKWQLVIPPDLAYGPRGAGQKIGPNATLIFDVELLAVNPEK